MYMVDAVLESDYLVKTIMKVIVFIIFPFIYQFRTKNTSVRQLFKVKSLKKLIFSFGLGVLVYIIILSAYFILSDWIDLAGIQTQLSANSSVNKDNFVLIALYISVANSILEELFFRGFLFEQLRNLIKPQVASGISAFAFAIYHVAIMAGWFTPALFLLAMLGLFVGGLIFNWLTAWSETIYSSWLVPMMANIAINTVGYIMFAII